MFFLFLFNVTPLTIKCTISIQSVIMIRQCQICAMIFREEENLNLLSRKIPICAGTNGGSFLTQVYESFVESKYKSGAIRSHYLFPPGFVELWVSRFSKPGGFLRKSDNHTPKHLK